MARFCSWCGEPLEPGARYCPECGARVLESVVLDGSADAVDKMRGFDIVGGREVPAQRTAKLDRDMVPDVSDGETSSADAVPSLDALPQVDQVAHRQLAEASAESAELEAGAVGQGCEEVSAGDSAETLAADTAAKSEAPEAACAGECGLDVAPSAPEPKGADAPCAAASGAQNAPDAKPAVPSAVKPAAAKPRPSDPSRTDTLVLPTSNEQRRFAAEEPKPDHRRTKAIVAGLTAVLLIAAAGAGYYLSTTHNAEGDAGNPIELQTKGDPTKESAEEAAQRKAEEQKAAEEKKAAEEAQRKLNEEEAHAALVDAYGKLPAYGDRIVACVDDYNGWFLDKNMDVRMKAKETADQVLADLQADLNKLESITLAEDSAYVTQAAQVKELYACQIGRIASMTDSWALDVTFDVPVQHKDEILAILSRDYVDGQSSYLTRYDELYPQVNL